MKKLYYAYVDMDMVSCFEEKLDKLKDNIDVIKVSMAESESGRKCLYYVLKTEEDAIHPKWELKAESV